MAPDVDTGSGRSIRERAFHNEWARQVCLDDLLVRPTFEAPTAVENRFILGQMGELRGRRILDLGCGMGEAAVYFALRGAKVWACDIAEGCIKVAERLAERYGVRLSLHAADSGRLPFRDGQFDFVYGNGVLHHVDIDASSREIMRVLKPGGRAFFIEPLPYNPVINIYRVLAREVRTSDEHPLSNQEMKILRQNFTRLRHEEFWFFSLMIFIYFFFVKRWHPGRVRYWKQVIARGAELQGVFEVLYGLDRGVLRMLPFLKPLCWNRVIIGEK